MAVESSAVIEDAPQADGRRYVRYRFDFAEGFSRTVGPKLVPSAFDAVADKDSLVSVVEQREKESELRRGEEALLNGVSVSAIQNNPQFNTNAEFARFVLKRMANALPSVNRQTLAEELPRLVLANQVFNALTDAQIANLLSVPESDVTAWRNSYQTMRSGIVSYGHSLPFFEGAE